ncbi:hypothetical protein N752_04140 [Desulforamulus aquiferis]|nr:hypothetical protein N752_04140 [Desulforamulus aquiferis]
MSKNYDMMHRILALSRWVAWGRFACHQQVHLLFTVDRLVEENKTSKQTTFGNLFSLMVKIKANTVLTIAYHQIYNLTYQLIYY